MNFQTSKRIMCCLMAALILCCAVVRPIEASATGLGALAVGKVVGFALEPAISAILVALGVTGTVAAFTELTKNISANVPAEYIIEALDGTKCLEAITYNDITYVSQKIVEWVQDCIWGRNSVDANIESVTYSYSYSYEAVIADCPNFWTDVWTSIPDYNKQTQFSDKKYVYAVEWTGGRDYFPGFLYFGNSEPVLEKVNNRYYAGTLFYSGVVCHVPEDAFLFTYDALNGYWWTFQSGRDIFFPNASTTNARFFDPGALQIESVKALSHTAAFAPSLSAPDYETWVFPGIHIIILPEDDPPPETEPEETEPPESEPPESQPAVPPTPSEPTPSEPEPEVTDPVELPDTDPSTPSEPETPEEDEPVVDPNKYETYIPVKFPNEILDPNEVTQPEIQTGNGSTQPEIETGNNVEIEDPNRTEDPTEPDTDHEWGDPVVWPDFPHVDTPEVPFPGTDNDYTGSENDTSWLTKIGEWIKWLGELIKEWIKWLGEYIVEWIKWLGEIVQLLPDAIAALLKLMVQWLVDAFKPLFQKLAEWLQPLMDYLLEGLKKLFVPKDGYFDEKIEILKSKFPLLNSVLSLADLLKAFFLGLGATPPIIYIDLGAGSGWHYMGGRTIFVDFSWYAQYKPTMDAILSAFLWLWFAWRLLLRMPGIIQGASAIEGTRESVYMIQEREKR